MHPGCGAGVGETVGLGGGGMKRGGGGGDQGCLVVCKGMVIFLIIIF